MWFVYFLIKMNRLLFDKCRLQCSGGFLKYVILVKKRCSHSGRGCKELTNHLHLSFSMVYIYLHIQNILLHPAAPYFFIKQTLKLELCLWIGQHINSIRSTYWSGKINQSGGWTFISTARILCPLLYSLELGNIISLNKCPNSCYTSDFFFSPSSYKFWEKMVNKMKALNLA